MPNTLGLDDDLDAVEVLCDLERIFDVKVSDEEAVRVLTVGEFHDLLLSKISANEAERKCPSAMTFYRIRSALRRLGYGQDLIPASDMRILERGWTKSNLERLEEEFGLHLPVAQLTRGGCVASLCFFFVALAGVYSLQPGIPSVLLGSLFGLVASVIIMYIDPGKLPINCTTLADFTKETTALNYGFLIKMGARHSSEDIWENLVTVLSRYAYPLPKSEITRETYFLQSRERKMLRLDSFLPSFRG